MKQLTMSVGLFWLYSVFFDSTTFSKVSWSQSSIVSDKKRANQKLEQQKAMKAKTTS